MTELGRIRTARLLLGILIGRVLGIRSYSLSTFAAAILTCTLANTVQAAGTLEQRQACTHDALRFCGAHVPRVPEITACMIENIERLSPDCRSQFDVTETGKPRRHGALQGPR